MARPTTIIALVQTSIVVVGLFTLGAVLKFSGYPSPDRHWSPLTIFLRQHGGWLLWLPVLWVIYANDAERRDRGFASSFAFLIGVSLAAILLSLFFYATLRPYPMPMTMAR